VSKDDIERHYREHGPALLLFAVAICGDRVRAQDVVQQVFLRLLAKANLNGIDDLKGYLFACVRNAALNEVKAGQRIVALDESNEALFDPPQKDYAAELSLRRALSFLPDSQREVTVLHLWGELTFAQIADVLGINADTAASRYRYALARLREAMNLKENSHADLR
jgi:RNA polymerase sigma factor (sigma-70 family)